MSAPSAAQRIDKARAIIDRRALSGQIADRVAEAGDATAARPAILAVLQDALAAGRAECERRLAERPGAGHAVAGAYAYLTDQLVRILYDHVVQAENDGKPARLTIIGVGGYGRAEMCPHSDVDILFLTADEDDGEARQIVETLLYWLWDLKLKVGHATRDADTAIALAREDLSVRTAMLEGRYVWGDEALYDACAIRFRKAVVQGEERRFVKEKLAERNARHKRMGDSRYVVEPNVKDGKGGLRDLQTLYWIGKFVHRVGSASELVDKGLLTRAEYVSFRRAERFLLAVRCHLHLVAGRAEERLTFDYQRAIATRMRFADRPGKSAVERFMQYYFLQAKRVGSLTGVFLSALDDEFARTRQRSGFFAGFSARARTVRGYRVQGGRIEASGNDWFARDPVRLIEIFAIAEAEGLEVHPSTMRLADRDAALIDGEVRDDPRANALFLDILTGRRQNETVLRWMNECGVLGRFVPDFGRVNAQMQFNMYHHYTVDEHSLRAVGLLAQIERGELAGDHPRATRFIHRVASRRVAYVAALLHDIAKGRGGDHSVLGEQIAMDLCPRFGLSQAETRLVAWLIRHHLLMSDTAQRRDLADPQTVEDFIAEVQSAERLRQLAILTVVDIRAVGPGVWNSWKGQLLSQLYDLAQERLRLGHARTARGERVAAKQAEVRVVLGERASLVERMADRLDDSYWIAESPEVIALNLVQFAAARELEHALSIHCEHREERGVTIVTVIAADHPGLFYRIAGGIHLAGANIIDARIHTTRDGWALDNFLVQNPQGEPFAEAQQLARLKSTLTDALSGRIALEPRLAARPLPHARSKAFDVDPTVVFDNNASGRFTVIEVNARDRSALLSRLAHALFAEGLIVHSAHITAYGERAADTFYVTDATGGKVTGADRLERLETALLHAASDAMQAQLEDA